MSELLPVGLAPQLSFSDIIHPLPPSPQDSQNRPESPGVEPHNAQNVIGSNELGATRQSARERPESPEPVGVSDVRGMKKAVLDMGFGREGGTEPSDATTKESILADMVSQCSYH